MVNGTLSVRSCSRGMGWALILRRRYSTSEVAERFADRLAKVDDPQRRFEYEHQRTIGQTTIPRSAPASAKAIAASEPWTGEEHFVEGSRRMLEDSFKPLKVSRSQRLSNARENVLDYQLNKEEGPTFKERLGAKQSAKRRPTHKFTSGLSSGGWLESSAASAIENAVAKGEFRDIPRGEKAQDTRAELLNSSRNPQIEFTEYLMNNIIKKQGGAPPWIMKHKAVQERIALFREQIRRRLQERLVHKVTALAGNSTKAAIKLANSKMHSMDPEWEANYKEFHDQSIQSINQQIRGYNLQAPPTARSGYLNTQEEIRRCYDTVTVGIEKEIVRYVGELSVPKAKAGELHSSLPPLESPEKHYGVFQLIKDLFSRTRV